MKEKKKITPKKLLKMRTFPPPQYAAALYAHDRLLQNSLFTEK